MASSAYDGELGSSNVPGGAVIITENGVISALLPNGKAEPPAVTTFTSNRLQLLSKWNLVCLL